MARAFIGVASNIEPGRHIERALELLAAELRVMAVSTFFLTEPLGAPGQDDYFNGVVEVETSLEPRDLKAALRRIEAAAGRVRTADRYAPRTLDLDVLVYGDLSLPAGDLRLPAPEICERPFVARALYELAPALVLPGSGRALREIVESFPGAEKRPLLDFTARMKERLCARAR